MEKREYVKPSVVTENDPKGIVPVAAAAIASGGAAVGFLAGYAATRAVTNASRVLAARAVNYLGEMQETEGLCCV
ncbi:hypothetical protein HMPREF9081_0899 [Centipeda periodontii DSM 2778]|uniref:Uncharacterized protein n=1 Tax=Centipeda periodontii DSM 2778 TaxID=888060 RepID=F5RKW4_9FIRM|nr:hypothetical protein [Centipeda periodontii]EGK60789.1 hypothetical protein HMPREF9081_0899 [Centipeda periodontii DSM 2778]